MDKSSRLTIILPGARVFCLGTLALLLTLTCDSGAGAVTFHYNGSYQNSNIKVLRKPAPKYWKHDPRTGCFHFDPRDAKISGRFLHPDAVTVLKNGSGKLKSFDATFIYGVHEDFVSRNGEAFMMVADDTSEHSKPVVFTEFHRNYETPQSRKDQESDNYTLSAEKDTFMNPEFNDQIRYKQIWIHYSEAHSRMDISYANYTKGKRKHAKRIESPSSSLLKKMKKKMKKKMYIGFSTAKGKDSSNFPHICAWSFSNDGRRAPKIVIAQDASPAALPPLPPASPPIRSPRSLPSPSPSPTSPSPSPSPISPSPSPSPISPSPNGRATPPSRSPPPPPPPVAPSPGPGHEPPHRNVSAVVGGSLAVLVVLICLFSLWRYTVWRRPLRIFICHTGGPNGAGKNFPSWLHQAMTSRRRWSRSKFHVKPFLDVENCPKGLSFAGKILKELERFDVGVVVVTQDFFSRHWPMAELIKFVEVQRKDREGRIRVLPLFYELTPDEVKQGLDHGTWENFWVEPSEDNHPLQLQECRDAVTWLCKQTGIRYVSHDRDQDKVYIDTILKEVDKILCDERSIAADLRWAMKKLNIIRSGPTATEIV